jgi:hypothetical protein
MLGVLAGLWLPFSVGWAWDGDWTQARSGRGDIFNDPDSSQGKAGTDPPQKFLTPNPRDFVDVDPDELQDYFHHHNKDYAPYALARITQDMHYNNLLVPKGYYLIKPGGAHAGSPRITLASLNATAAAGSVPTQSPEESLPPMPVMGPTTPATWNQSAAQTSGLPMPLVPAAQPSPTMNQNAPVYQVFVLKRQGKVMGVVPINRMEDYTPPRGQKLPKQALAWIEMENQHPVLKFYYKKRLYCTDFQ